MSLIIDDKEINNVCVIDDDAQARHGWSLAIEDSKLHPFPQNEKVLNIDDYIPYLQRFDAIVTDHHLMKKNYFPVNGAEIVYRCYDYKIPSILVTRYDDEKVVDEIRRYRNKIPIILSQEEYAPDTLRQGLEICLNEFKGKLLPERKLWRTFIRIDDIDKTHVYLLIPAWNPNKVVSINRNLIQEEILKVLNPDMKMFAQVNIEAKDVIDLYFKNWELK
jgi:hypothetical protein